MQYLLEKGFCIPPRTSFCRSFFDASGLCCCSSFLLLANLLWEVLGHVVADDTSVDALPFWFPFLGQTSLQGKQPHRRVILLGVKGFLNSIQGGSDLANLTFIQAEPLGLRKSMPFEDLVQGAFNLSWVVGPGPEDKLC